MNNLNFDFRKKTVLITAGTNGIGLELTKSFLKSGANVATFSRSDKNLNNLSKRCKNFISQKKLLVFKHDLNKLGKENFLIKKIEKYFKNKVDILINNSGGPPPKLITKTSDKDWSKAMNINFFSSLKFSKNVIPGMRSKKWGRIINLTSLTAKEPSKRMILSNVTRAAISSFAKTLSLELEHTGITVNTILTGGCLTDRLINLIKKNSKKTQITNQLKKLSNQVPVGNIAEPYEFIQTVLFLASNNSSYLNGVSIPVDGGISKSIF
jgi:3-oxoacyl-[acyl-carrier protein] reductase